MKKDHPNPSTGKIPFSAPLAAAAVTLEDMRNGNTEGLIIGNGDLYGLIWNREGESLLRITKNDVWDARVDTSEDGPLPTVDLATGEVTGSRGGQASWEDHPYPQPRCAVALRLGPVPAPFRGHLDLQRAVVELGSESMVETAVRVLADRNVVLVTGSHPVSLEEIVADTLPPADRGCSDGVDWLHMSLPGDVDYDGMQYAVAVAVRGSMKAVSLVTSWDQPGADLIQVAVDRARETAAEAEQHLIDLHEQGWREFWSRSGVLLDDPVLQRWWYRTVYFAGTVCRPGTAPVGIMPPLSTDVTPWHADYHHNYNTWQCFLPLAGLNHPERADPWISYNHDMIPRYKNLARMTFGIEGVHVPISSFLHEPAPAECRSVNQRQLSLLPWGLTIGLQAMTLQSMWQKYLYDQNREYMEAKIFPYLREVARFYVNFLERCTLDAQGKLRVGPSYSPEHGGPGIYNCPFDIAYIHYTFDAMVEASACLDQEADLAEACRRLKGQLPEVPTAPAEDGEPIVVDWDGCSVGDVKLHNITVPASPVFPADQVTWFDDEATKALYRRTIDALNFRDANAHVMLNIARARLSMPHAITRFKAWFETRERANGLFEWVGHQHAVYMPEMIGIAGFINEVLLQSVGNKLRLFPCWPKDVDAHFHQLRAQGGFLVSASLKEGRVASVTIVSEAGNTLKLCSPWGQIVVNGKSEAIDDDGIVTLMSQPGQILICEEKENL